MEEVRTNSGQNLGIAALIVGIITFIIAVIPCLGMIAIIPGIITIVLASVGMSQASRQNSPRGVLIAGLIIGIIAVLISFSQFFVLGKLAGHKDKWPVDIRSAIEDVRKDVMKDMEDANVSIKIESNGDTVEIKAKTRKKLDLEQKLQDLETGHKEKADSVRKVK